MKKRILFVSYGGGHVRMIAPVLSLLQGHSGLATEFLALTTARPVARSLGLPHWGFKDFLTPQDEAARSIGNRLAATHHTPGVGIEEEESTAYLGVSYQEMVEEHGQEEAARLWQEQGRHAFLPRRMLARIMDRLKPDFVVATNSPRAERAALDVALARGIPCLCMTDLLGFKDFHIPAADYFTVLSEFTIEQMKEYGVTAPREHFFITGNPAFDGLFEHRGPSNAAWRAEHFPQIPPDMPLVLWIDGNGYFRTPPYIYVRDQAEMLLDLETLADAARANHAALLIRPHPSQNKEFFTRWIAQCGAPHVVYGGEVPLYPLLNITDAVITYGSSVSLETILMERKLVQLKYFPEDNGMPLPEMGMAWQAGNRAALPGVLGDALQNTQAWNEKRARIHRFTPSTPAAPQVAALLERLITCA